MCGRYVITKPVSKTLDLVKTKELPEITDFYQKNPHINLLFNEDSK